MTAKVEQPPAAPAPAPVTLIEVRDALADLRYEAQNLGKRHFDSYADLFERVTIAYLRTREADDERDAP